MGVSSRFVRSVVRPLGDTESEPELGLELPGDEDILPEVVGETQENEA